MFLPAKFHFALDVFINSVASLKGWQSYSLGLA